MCDATQAIYHQERKKKMNPNFYIGIVSAIWRIALSGRVVPAALHNK
jgi:hypothetical protein